MHAQKLANFARKHLRVTNAFIGKSKIRLFRFNQRFEESQDCLLQTNELLKQYPNDQVIDYSGTGTEEILQKQQLARSANNSLKSLHEI